MGRLTRIGGGLLASSLLALSMAACGSDDADGGSGGGDAAGQTLTYWASNQGTSIENDQQVLKPEPAKFTQQTGIKVDVEVVPWSDLLNRILAATTSGKGPDVLNIGNTWSASLQATGAFTQFDDATLAKVGGKDRFLAGSLSATGAPGKPPTALPIYSLAYGLYYNKKYFAEAGIEKPPTTWEEPGRRRQEAHDEGPLGAVDRGRQRQREHPQRVHLQPAAGRRVLRRRGQADVRHPAERGRHQAVRRPHPDRQDHQPQQRRVRQRD
ncbi:hypothetical protein GCM10025868_34550 [Angustibacter aerolatus]|uniref:Extracellular solute-binding protein n=1 Tax=Angustibacter aerolatus TaxID=1162965 RepID=A0ABQ6JLU0_9ACTN|nr:extracellular solute-binding protein [Angustibacter aerolatus]GMA88205.1 hypothetical protein GCM10025868_34550 [Angustibacter aerolatus]